MKGNKKLQCAMTLSGGDIVYDPYGYSSPVWQNIPKDSDYWVNPSGQFW